MTADSDLPTGNILEAKEKFDRMFKELQTKKAFLETELIMIKEQVAELNAQKQAQRTLLEKLNDEYYKERAHSEDMLQALKQKLDTANQERQRLENRESQVTEQYDQAKEENAKLKGSKRERETRDRIRSDLLKDEMDKVNSEIAAKEAIIADLEAKRAEYVAVLESDTSFKTLRETYERLNREIKEKELENNELAYKSFELDNLQKLAVKQKELDAEERRKLTEERERLKRLYNDTIKMNELRVERVLREQEPEEIKQLRSKLKIEEIQLEDVKDKWSNVNLIYTKFKTDLNHRIAEDEEYSKKLDALKADIEKYNADIAAIEPEVRDERLRCEDMENTLDTKIEEKSRLADKRIENEKIMEGLRAKYLYLTENFDLGKELQNINLDELKHVMNSNTNVNNTISQLLNKWDNIQSFSTGHLNSR